MQASGRLLGRVWPAPSWLFPRGDLCHPRFAYEYGETSSLFFFFISFYPSFDLSVFLSILPSDSEEGAGVFLLLSSPPMMGVSQYCVHLLSAWHCYCFPSSLSVCSKPE